MRDAPPESGNVLVCYRDENGKLVNETIDVSLLALDRKAQSVIAAQLADPSVDASLVQPAIDAADASLSTIAANQITQRVADQKARDDDNAAAGVAIKGAQAASLASVPASASVTSIAVGSTV